MSKLDNNSIAISSIDPIDRCIRRSETSEAKGSYVLYWMQQAQRLSCNPALALALDLARKTKLPMAVVFVLSPSVPDANIRHYHFMLQGIAEVANELQRNNISFTIYKGEPDKIIPIVAENAIALVMDSGYLRFQRNWREDIWQQLKDTSLSLYEVDTEAIIPVHLASDKEEYSAATLRRKMLPALPLWLAEGSEVQLKSPPKPVSLPKLQPCLADFKDFHELWQWAIGELDISPNPGIISGYPAGYRAAKSRLEAFSEVKLPYYYDKKNHPGLDFQSGISPYLHFGQISPNEVLQIVFQTHGVDIAETAYLIGHKDQEKGLSPSLASFAEELIIRRELSMNFCKYNDAYDSFSALPTWAKNTLWEHMGDKREQHYSLDRLEQADTDDVYWNAAQMEMMKTGKMHNYMRMYWGKRILAWCEDVETAYRILIYMNNKYELDGRDANAYAGIAWCFGKHDRPWATRPIYGSVRYMNANGLLRKFDMNAYLSRVKGGF